jgi:hypothetical protein
MSEDTNEPAPAPGEPFQNTAPVPPVEPVETTAATAPAKARFQDRVLGMKAVAGVALASVVLGGAGGAVLGAISNGDDSGSGNRFGGPMTNMMPGQDGNQLQQPSGGQMVPPGTQGQLPPGLPPQDGSTESESGDSTDS